MPPLPPFRAQLATLAGRLAIELGAGRTRADQPLDHAAGFVLRATVGERVTRGAPLLTIHAKSRKLAQQVHERAAAAFALGPRAPRRPALVMARLR